MIERKNEAHVNMTFWVTHIKRFNLSDARLIYWILNQCYAGVAPEKEADKLFDGVQEMKQW